MRLRRKAENSRSTPVIMEAELLLSGCLPEPAPRSRPSTSSWRVINTLAHGSHPDLQRLTSLVETSHPASWTAAVGYLASEMLGIAPDNPRLLRLQRGTLVPLELDMLDHKDAAPTRPAALVALVMGALEEHQMFPDY